MNSYLSTYLLVALGVVISVVLPILRALLPQLPTKSERSSFIEENVMPYIIVAAFSLVSAVLIVAGIGPDVNCEAALLAGYAWDSTIQKMKGPMISDSK